MAEQRRLAGGGTVKVVTADSQGGTGESEVPATMLTTQQARLAFDHGRIRSVAEQSNMIDSARVAARRRQPQSRSYRMRIDVEAGRVHVGRMTLSVDEVLAALSDAGVIPNKQGA